MLIQPHNSSVVYQFSVCFRAEITRSISFCAFFFIYLTASGHVPKYLLSTLGWWLVCIPHTGYEPAIQSQNPYYASCSTGTVALISFSQAIYRSSLASSELFRSASEICVVLIGKSPVRFPFVRFLFHFLWTVSYLVLCRVLLLRWPAPCTAAPFELV